MAPGAEDEEEPPQGVIVCVRVRPLFAQRPDGTPAREANCKRIVEMEDTNPAKGACGSAVTKIYDPNDMNAKPKEYCFDRSYWSCDGFQEDPERPGVHIPDGPDSKYVSQDMVWNDIGGILMKNIFNGYNCTCFAYGQSGSGKSYSVVGYPPNVGIIPNTMQAIFDLVDSSGDPNVRYQVEIAMLEVYMDEVYDLLEPRKKERQKMNVFINKGQVFVYDPKDRKNMDKMWRASKNYEQAEHFRNLGDANRTVRATGMNPTSSRGHTLFMMRFRKEAKCGDAWVEQLRSKVSLVDLAGSERAHDTGLTGIGLEEGIAINMSLSALGNVLMQLCKGEKANFRDKLTMLLAESLGGNAVTMMIAALSPADINYNDTLSTLRFADNAKKMPVKVKKQTDPTAQLIEDLKKENEKLKGQMANLGDAEGLERVQQAAAEKDAFEQKLKDAEAKLTEMSMQMSKMETTAAKGGRLRIAVLPFRTEDKNKIQEYDRKVADLRAEMARMTQNDEDNSGKRAELEALLAERKQAVKEAEAHAEEAIKNSKADLEIRASEMEVLRKREDEGVDALKQELAAMRSAVQQLAQQGQDNSEERSRLAERERLLAEEEAKYQQAASDEKQAVETLLEAHLAEIEELVRERDRKHAEAASARASGDEATLVVLMEGISLLDQALKQARADYQGLESRAADVGDACRFRAAQLSLQCQQADKRARRFADDVTRLRAKGDSAELSQAIEAQAEAQRALLILQEEARAASEAALAEKMSELQALKRERDQAHDDAFEARERAGGTEEELREKQAAIEAIIASENMKWEDKLAQSEEAEHKLQKSFEDMGLSVQEILSAFKGSEGDSAHGKPYFVNLCEHAHDDGLLYLIPEGTSRVKRFEDNDAEQGIKLDGETIRGHHATLNFDVERFEVSIRQGEPEAVLWVDGDAVTSDAMVLEHGDRVIFGTDFVFRYVDPRVKKAKGPLALDARGRPVIADWKYAMEELSRKGGLDVEAQISEMRDRLQAQLSDREAELAEEQRLLEERMSKEREQFEEEISQLKASQALGSFQTAAGDEKLRHREAAQAKTQSALAQFQSRIAMKRSRAQWVRATYRSLADDRFELDVRVARQQMTDLQPRVMEANRISAAHNRKVTYAFHVMDAVDPRSRKAGHSAEAHAADSKGKGADIEAAVIDDETLLARRVLVSVQATHLDTKEEQLWPQQKFLDRFTRMLSFANGTSLATFFDEEDARHEDIFWDQVDHALVGTAAIGLTPLLKMKEVFESVTLRDIDGEVKGVLSLSLGMSGGNIGESLANKHLRGHVKFGRFTGVSDCWAGQFVRFSWFETHGRMTNECPVFEGANVDHTFSFEHVGTPAFLDYLSKGVFTLQVRAYAKGKGKDLELRDLRIRARRAEAELSEVRGRARVAGNGAGAGASTGAPSWEAIDKAKAEAAESRHEADQLRKELEGFKAHGAPAALPGMVPAAETRPEAVELKRRVDELEAQLRTAKDGQMGSGGLSAMVPTQPFVALSAEEAAVLRKRNKELEESLRQAQTEKPPTKIISTCTLL